MEYSNCSSIVIINSCVMLLYSTIIISIRFICKSQ